MTESAGVPLDLSRRTRGAAGSVWLVAAVAAALAGLMFVEDLGGGTLERLLLYLPGVDKVLHVAQSAVLVVALRSVAARFARTRGSATLVASIITLCIAVLDELQQMWRPDRSVEAADILAAVAGTAIGAGWSMRSRRELAAVVAAAGVLCGAFVTYRSYTLTKDYKWALRLEGQGRFTEAREAYRRALAAGVTGAGIYNSVAWVEIESGVGDPAVAVDYAERSLALRPNDADALDTYGWALYHQGRLDDARARLMEAYTLKPDIFCIHYHLGLVDLRQGRTPQAVEHFRAQVARAPRSREAQRSREELAGLPHEGLLTNRP
jgi:Tetratricopeptide repeat